MKNRSYQTKIIKQAKSLMFERGKVAICAACASGKTYMATRIIRDYLKENPKSRVLVLAHGRTILRNQFYNELLNNNIDVEQYLDDLCPENKVIVALPHIRLKDIPQFDLVVIDEAHEYYQASMAQTVLQKTIHKHLLLLTGSASYFVKNNYPRVMFSTQELREAMPDALANITTFIVQTTYDLDDNEYNRQDNLKDTVSISLEDTESSLARAIWHLINALRRNIGEEPHLFNNEDLTFRELSKNKNISKTIIAAPSIKQAEYIHSILSRYNINTIISTAQNDLDSEYIDEFKINPKINILVVVNRGKLGFDMPELKNFIDMTGTENPDIIYQMLGRVSRNDFQDKPKIFIKTSPINRLFRTELSTCFALALTCKEIYETYDGSYRTTKFPILQKDKEKTSVKKTPKSKKSNQPQIIDLADYTDMLNHLWHKDDEIANAIAWVSLNEEFEINKKWTLRVCIEDAKQYNSRSEWRKASSGAYNAARRNDWLNICCKQMRKLKKENGTWTLEACIEDAKQYNSRSEWRKASSGAYHTAHKKGWYKICCEHMLYILKIGTLDECIEEAKKYDTKKEWIIKSKRTYNIARRRHGWVDICCKHMKKSMRLCKPIKWTLEVCIENAKQYNTRGEWKRKQKKAYSAAQRNGWLDICSKHMKTELKD